MNITIVMNTLKSIFNNDKRDLYNERNRDIIIKLKFIGTFQPGEKIDVRNLKIEDNTIITPIKRTIFGESRDSTYTFLSSTIERAFDIILVYANSDKTSEKIICKNILNDVIKAVNGLQNIQKTYDSDKMFYCNVETLVECIHAKLSEIKEKHPSIFSIKTISEDII
jgi:hypothetical protein